MAADRLAIVDTQPRESAAVEGPPPPPTRDPIPELTLDKKPPAVARQRKSRLPPYTGLLIGVAVVILVAVGYGIYLDAHREGIPDPQAITPRAR